MIMKPLMMSIQSLVPTPDPEAVAAKQSEKIAELKSLSFDDLIQKIASGIVDLAIDLAVAILVFYIGKFIIRKISTLVESILLRRKVETSLSTFILSFIRIVLYFLLIIVCVGIVGIETSSFIALFASAGVALGMALSGTLQNFAGGVLIMLLKPYRIGHFIETQGYTGTVSEIQIFSTIINTPDNKRIIIPNGPISTGSINNWTQEKYRRVNWDLGISYGGNIDAARTAIIEMFKSDPRIVTQYDDSEEPVPPAQEADLRHDRVDEARRMEARSNSSWFRRMFSPVNLLRQPRRIKNRPRSRILTPAREAVAQPAVYVSELAASSVVLTIRAWVKSEDYWGVYYDYNERFYTTFQKPDSPDVTFPFPQLDVHIRE